MFRCASCADLYPTDSNDSVLKLRNSLSIGELTLLCQAAVVESARSARRDVYPRHCLWSSFVEPPRWGRDIQKDEFAESFPSTLMAQITKDEPGMLKPNFPLLTREFPEQQLDRQDIR